MLSLFPFFCAAYLTVGTFDKRYSSFDKVTTGIVESRHLDNTVPGDNNALKMVTFIGVIVGSGLLIIMSCIFECHLCCNVTFVRGQRVQENNRDIFKLVLFLALALCIYLPTAYICYYRFCGLHCYKAPEEIIAAYLDDKYESIQIWAKVQIWFECCGIHNYTYWYDKLHDTHVLPDSCCKTYKTGCGNFTRIEDINEAGCLPNVTTHVTDQVRYHTDEQQGMFLNLGLISFFICLAIIMWIRNKCRDRFKCCKNKENITELVNEEDEVEDREQLVGSDIEETPDNENNVDDDDAIINIENVIENDTVNGAENGTISDGLEMDETVVVHQDAAADDEHLIE